MLRMLIIGVCGVLLLTLGCKEGAKEAAEVGGERSRPVEAQETDETDNGRPVVRLTTNYGDIDIELRPDVAPKTCENFIKLTNEGFYDNTVFHRIIAGFMMQGGDPEGTGMGGPGYTVPAEISDLKHLAGTVATARQGDNVNPERASSGSQFYICFVPTPHLDGQYTIFGKVIQGMETVKKIEGVQVQGSKPVEPVKLVKAKVID